MTSYDKFLKEEAINGAKPKTIATHRSILKNADKFKSLGNKWDKDDVNDFILRLQEEYKVGSVEIHKGLIKKFWNWDGKPEIVDHVKVRPQKTNLRREDIPTPQDITLMIETTTSLMYKALFAFTFEAGARINEIVRVIKVKELEETNKGLIIPVHETKAKEDYRRILCVFSGQYIKNYIEVYKLKPDDMLFPISSNAAYNMFVKIAKQAGIKKHITPHKSRHGQATDMVLRGYQESIIKKKLGLTNDSRMLARYQHVVDEDVINATAEKAGILEVSHESSDNISKTNPLFQVADNSLQLAKLAEENKALKAEMQEFKDSLRKDLNRTLKLLGLAIDFSDIEINNMKIIKKARQKTENW
jgi:integrase